MMTTMVMTITLIIVTTTIVMMTMIDMMVMTTRNVLMKNDNDSTAGHDVDENNHSNYCDDNDSNDDYD
jgi:hypothetical protein